MYSLIHFNMCTVRVLLSRLRYRAFPSLQGGLGDPFAIQHHPTSSSATDGHYRLVSLLELHLNHDTACSLVSHFVPSVYFYGTSFSLHVSTLNAVLPCGCAHFMYPCHRGWAFGLFPGWAIRNEPAMNI